MFLFSSKTNSVQTLLDIWSLHTCGSTQFKVVNVGMRGAAGRTVGKKPSVIGVEGIIKHCSVRALIDQDSFIIRAWGEELCFIFNFLSFLARRAFSLFQF